MENLLIGIEVKRLLELLNVKWIGEVVIFVLLVLLIW